MDKIQAEMLRDSLQGIEVGGWLISGFHGNGKSAVVLAAQKDGTVGAIKVFHPELVERYGKAAQLERISREKSLIGASHANLVQILDGGECAITGYLFVVMESLPYKNLHEKNSLIPVSAIRRIISQVASAARFLEDRGLAHRDIKPENIAISDDFSRAVLLDLGVLLPVGASNLTDVDQRLFIGTLRYSSPEFLLREEESTAESWRAITFYQIGAVLHDLLMKKVLFEEFSEPFSKLVEAVKSETPKIFSEDTKCVSLANRCLIKNPATRLELVSWSDLIDVENDDTNDAIAARERIKQRQIFYSQTTAHPNQSSVNGSVNIKRTLDDLCNRFESRIAALLNDLQCFPLRATCSEKSVPEKKCTVCIQFESDDELGLPQKFAIMFEIELIDENSGNPIFRAAASAGISNAEIDANQLNPTSKFHSGNLQSLLDSATLEQVLLDSLEAAYMVNEQGTAPSDDNLLRLTVKQIEGPTNV